MSDIPSNNEIIAEDKENLLSNYRFAIVSQKHHVTRLVKDEKEVQRSLNAKEIAAGDIIIELDGRNLRIAERRDYIELI